jgi:hypothetical protein
MEFPRIATYVFLVQISTDSTSNGHFKIAIKYSMNLFYALRVLKIHHSTTEKANEVQRGCAWELHVLARGLA